MKKIMLIVVFGLFINNCFCQDLKEINTQLIDLKTNVTDLKKVADDLKKNIDELVKDKKNQVNKSVVLGYIGLKDAIIFLYDSKDTKIESALAKRTKEEDKYKLPDEERYTFLIIDSVHIIIDYNKVKSVVIFSAENLYIMELDMEFKDINGSTWRGLEAGGDKIRLNDLLKYWPRGNETGDVQEIEVQLTPKKTKASLTKTIQL